MQEKSYDYDYEYEISKKIIEKKISIKKREIQKIISRVQSDRLALLHYVKTDKVGKIKNFEAMRKILVRNQKLLFVLLTMIKEYQLSRREIAVL
jgi:hypothetical protein